MSNQPEDPHQGPSLDKSRPDGGTPQYGQPAQYGPAPQEPQPGPSQYGPPQYGPPPQSGYPQPGQQYQGYPAQGYGNYQAGPGYPNQPYGAPAGGSDERTMAIIAHIGGPVVALLSVGSLHWVPALIVYLVYKDRSPFVRQHASEALNFQITLLIAYVVSWFLAFIIIGIFTWFVAWVLAIIFGILATMAASRGEPYRYPINIRMVS